MIPFKKYRSECIFRNDKICTYWDVTQKPTHCHLLVCPFYSNVTTPKRRQALERKVKDTVTFHPSDLDNTGKTIKDIIHLTQSEGVQHLDRPENRVKQSVVTEKLVSRLTCLACGEIIDDDKFITIRDPHEVIIYLHSKGKCDRRHDQLHLVRERWLQMRQQNDVITDVNDHDNDL